MIRTVYLHRNSIDISHLDVPALVSGTRLILLDTLPETTEITVMRGEFGFDRCTVGELREWLSTRAVDREAARAAHPIAGDDPRRIPVDQ